ADECGRQIAIDLDGDDATRSRCQRAGQRSAPGPDFEEGFIARRVDCVDELGDPDRLEEVLAEPLPWRSAPIMPLPSNRSPRASNAPRFPQSPPRSDRSSGPPRESAFRRWR